MLEEAMSTCSRSQQCSILFCDEMSSVVSHLDKPILEHLCEEVTGNFQDGFLLEVADGVPVGAAVPMEFLYGLDVTDDEGTIALNLLPMVVASNIQPGGGGGGGGCVAETDSGGGLLGMAARFHLLRTCEQQLRGTLEGIDALLGIALLP